MSEPKLKRVDLIFGEYSSEKYKVLADTLKRSNEEILDDLKPDSHFELDPDRGSASCAG